MGLDFESKAKRILIDLKGKKSNPLVGTQAVKSSRSGLCRTNHCSLYRQRNPEFRGEIFVVINLELLVRFI